MVAGPHDHEEGFNYSPALEKFKGQPWTYEALNEWLFKPSQVAPGTRMTFAGIPSAKDRANVIAYLRTLSQDPVPLPKPGETAPAAATPAAAARGRGRRRRRMARQEPMRRPNCRRPGSRTSRRPRRSGTDEALMRAVAVPLTGRPRRLIAGAEAAADVAGAVIRPFFRARLNADLKSDHSPVTIADRSAEQAMRAVLTRAVSGAWRAGRGVRV